MEQPPSLSPLEQAFLNQQRMVQQQADPIAVLQASLQRMEVEFHRQRPSGSGASGSGGAGTGGGGGSGQSFLGFRFPTGPSQD